MLRTVLLLSSICGLVRSSGFGEAHLAPVGPAVGHIAPVANAPVVTAASSQYFQRTFNRLVVPPVVAPVVPVAPPPLAPVPVAPAPLPVAPAPTAVFIAPTKTVPVAVNPPPPQNLEPNVAIAVATAHAAAPVATFLLPPYPFGFPPNFGLVPVEQSTNTPDENTTEPTTERTTEAETTTTPEPESTTPFDASSSDNNFVQALPSNENVNFNLYGPPPPGPRPQFPSQPQQPGPQFRPQQPNPQFQPPQPRPQFNGNQPNPQFQPAQPRPQFNGNQPNPQFQPSQPRPQFNGNQPNPQFRPQQPEFPPYPPQQEQPRPQFQPQAGPQPQPQFPTFSPQQQQPHPVYLPQAKPQQQPRPLFQARPQQPWPQQKPRPQKLKTSVEVVPVPLAYITPPPVHKTHAHVKVVKHIYSYVPASHTKIILKPVKIRPIRLVKHKIISARSQNLRANARDIELTTFNPFPRPNTKPPRV